MAGTPIYDTVRKDSLRRKRRGGAVDGVKCLAQALAVERLDE
jgi:hypothetical protein